MKMAFSGKCRINCRLLDAIRSLKFIMILFISFSYIFCQEGSEKYITASFKPGLPSSIKVDWNNTLYSSISGGEFYKEIFMISSDSLKTTDNFWLYLAYENGYDYKRLNFDKVENNIYQATISLKNVEEDKLSPLIIILSLNENSFKYRWKNKNKDNISTPTIIEEYKLKVGKNFPKISLETSNGNWTNENKNKLVVINWWATSCAPCIEEMPGLNKLVEKYPQDKVEFIAIVWDKENLPEFLGKREFKYIQGYSNPAIKNLFGEPFPRNIIISKEGSILFNRSGGSEGTASDLEKVIDANL